MAVNWPLAKLTVTPSRARTLASPRPYTLTASAVRAASACGWPAAATSGIAEPAVTDPSGLASAR